MERSGLLLVDGGGSQLYGILRQLLPLCWKQAAKNILDCAAEKSWWELYILNLSPVKSTLP